MILIYVPKLNPRIEYGIELCFKHAFKIDYSITSDLHEFKKSDLPSLWYAPEKVSDKPGVIADAMMLDSKIFIKSPGRTYLDKITVLFPTETNFLPKFDLFAAAFWLATRMEEYGHAVTNPYNRFSSDMSIARKVGILNKPAINIWTEMYLETLQRLYPDLKYEKPAYKFMPTIDVDSAFKYKAKGLFRTLGGTLRDLYKLNFEEVKQRYKVLIGKAPDPWFCFDEINKLHEEFDLKPYYFFLVARFGNFDRNISPWRKKVKNLIADLVSKYNVGIHTSFKGKTKPKYWVSELKTLQKLTGQKIFSSRQHYFIVQFPDTYEKIIELGIKRDFSMVFPDMPGFRLGTSVPIPFFNLKTNQKTDLWLYPTMIMDVSLSKYQNLSVEEAIELCKPIIEYTKKYGGTLITLWHNETLSGTGIWKNSPAIYKEILKLSVE
ncbi:MAG: polysaccharide deacetylase family protein [Bacteroidales bacterium]